ncbi:MAG: hypothetical protein AB1540_17065 [Bdellovibrionota bacterium]
MVTSNKIIKIERVQTGVRIEKKILKVLKGLADYSDMSVGQMLELILLHSFENRLSFTKKTLEVIASLKKIHSLDYGAHGYMAFIEKEATQASQAKSRGDLRRANDLK